MSEATHHAVSKGRRWTRRALVAASAVGIAYAIGVDRGEFVLAFTKGVVTRSGRSPTLHALLTVGFVFFGLLLYLFKRYGRARYGALEVTFAIAIMWYALGESSNPPEAVFAELVGACYVFVRGLENIEQGVSQWRR